MRTVLHSDDMNLLDYWKKSLGVNSTQIDELSDLLELKNALIIMSYSVYILIDNSSLNKLIQENKLLVLHRTPDISTAKKVLKMGSKGYGNAFMNAHFIISAVETIKDGMIWLYPEFTTMLIEEIESSSSISHDIKLEPLTHREKEVALFLKDGNTYKDIAQKLNITPRTIKAHAQNIYAKLAVKDRLGLALFLK